MKKGETYTGRVQHVDFPNKAVVFTESENPEDNGQKKMHRQKRQTDVSISEHAAAVSTRVCSMKNS